jgi:hypothetical protein
MDDVTGRRALFVDLSIECVQAVTIRRFVSEADGPRMEIIPDEGPSARWYDQGKFTGALQVPAEPAQVAPLELFHLWKWVRWDGRMLDGFRMAGWLLLIDDAAVASFLAGDDAVLQEFLPVDLKT